METHNLYYLTCKYNLIRYLLVLARSSTWYEPFLWPADILWSCGRSLGCWSMKPLVFVSPLFCCCKQASLLEDSICWPYHKSVLTDVKSISAKAITIGPCACVLTTFTSNNLLEKFFLYEHDGLKSMMYVCFLSHYYKRIKNSSLSKIDFYIFFDFFSWFFFLN